MAGLSPLDPARIIKSGNAPAPYMPANVGYAGQPTPVQYAQPTPVQYVQPSPAQYVQPSSAQSPVGGGYPAAYQFGVASPTAAPVLAPNDVRRASGPLGDHDKFKKKLLTIVENQDDLMKKVKKNFNKFAKLHQGSPEKSMDQSDIQALTKMLGAQLECETEAFGDCGQMFYRFDVDGDGLLHEAEACRLCMYMLRRYRDHVLPPKPGSVQLGGKIEFKNLNAKHAVIKKLGEGGQGAVFLAKDKNTGQEVVVKTYDKSNASNPVEDITHEFELLMGLKHPRIAHVFEIFQDWANIYIVQEPYFGGDLTTAVSKATEAGVKVNEVWLSRVMFQVLSGVAFLHSKSVMHCDLKEANVMIAGKSTGKEEWENPQIVVIDFGLAYEFHSKSYPGGTPGYIPPEVWDYGLWTPKGDVFSLGVMIFAMRTGMQPFVEGCNSIEEVQRETRNRNPVMTLGSSQCKKVTMSMINKSFQDRPLVVQLLEDPWFSGAADESSTIDSVVLDNLTKRQQRTELQRAVMTELAAHQNLAQMKDLNELFLRLDADNNGFVSEEELRAGLEGKWPQARIDQLITALVGNSQTEISYEEFMGQLMTAQAARENTLLWQVFSEVDTQAKGYLDLKDIEGLISRPAVAGVLGSRDPEAILKQLDADSDNKVTFDEFRLAMQSDAHTSTSTPSGGSGGGGGGSGGIYSKWHILQYYSTTHSAWIPCTVVEAHATGAVQVDCKPGYWFSGVELRTKLRAPKRKESHSGKGALGRQLINGVMGIFG